MTICDKMQRTVEAINGLLKTLFRVNDKSVDNKSLFHSIEDLKVCASIINKYHQRLYSDIDNPSVITNHMKTKLYAPNKLESVVETLNRKRKVFTNISISSLNDFPKLDFNIIKYNITSGSYQLKQ